jgi:hypothetical protein
MLRVRVEFDHNEKESVILTGSLPFLLRRQQWRFLDCVIDCKKTSRSTGDTKKETVNTKKKKRFFSCFFLKEHSIMFLSSLYAVFILVDDSSLIDKEWCSSTLYHHGDV